MALGNSDGRIRKTCKLNLYGTAMYDLVTADKTYLPGHDVMNTYAIDLAVAVETQLKTVLQLVNMVDISLGT